MLGIMISIQKELFEKWIRRLPNDNVIKTIYLILTADANLEARNNSKDWSALASRRSGQFGHQAAIK